MSPTKAVPKIAAPQANEGRLMTILLAPVVSEKATQIADRHNQVIFRVRPDATKKDVKKAVELLWKEKKIEVASVQIVNVHGKKKRFGTSTGRKRHKVPCPANSLDSSRRHRPPRGVAQARRSIDYGCAFAPCLPADLARSFIFGIHGTGH